MSHFAEGSIYFSEYDFLLVVLCLHLNLNFINLKNVVYVVLFAITYVYIYVNIYLYSSSCLHRRSLKKQKTLTIL